MKIYLAEIKDGVSDQVAKASSISYASLAGPAPSSVGKKQIKEMKTFASFEDEDLYYVQSILVTSSWNKNDDIFDSHEIWLAKNTPEDKPTNLEHDESLIIGHITSNWPIDEQGNIIPEDTDLSELPDKYHILTGSVIYNGFSQPELRERSQKLISQIESGEKFVSMECFFKGFDYGLRNKETDEYHVLPRSEKTSHLTKYLRAYGGLGEHENYKIGRVLRNITFSGKGFVNKPANPESIIFSSKTILEKKNDDFTKTGVSMNKSTSNMEIYEMSENKEAVVTIEEELTPAAVATVVAEGPASSETEQAVVAEEQQVTETKQVAMKEEEMMMKKKEEEMKKKQMAMKEEDMKKKEEDMKKKEEALVTKMKAEFAEELAKVGEESKVVLAEKEEVLAKLELDLAAANEVIAAYKEQEENMKKKEKKMQRMASLIEAGVPEGVASSAVDSFETINDAAFEAIAAVFASQKKSDVVELTEEPKAESSAEKTSVETETEAKASVTESVDASVLENVEVEKEVNLGVGSEDSSDVNSTRAELLEFVCARLGKTLNKGE
jgi:hypothetical protein